MTTVSVRSVVPSASRMSALGVFGCRYCLNGSPIGWVASALVGGWAVSWKRALSAYALALSTATRVRSSLGARLPWYSSTAGVKPAPSESRKVSPSSDSDERRHSAEESPAGTDPRTSEGSRRGRRQRRGRTRRGECRCIMARADDERGLGALGQGAQ